MNQHLQQQALYRDKQSRARKRGPQWRHNYEWKSESKWGRAPGVPSKHHGTTMEST